MISLQFKIAIAAALIFIFARANYRASYGLVLGPRGLKLGPTVARPVHMFWCLSYALSAIAFIIFAIWGFFKL